MSARRINPSGKPIVLIDEGPAVGRIRQWDEMRRVLDVAFTVRRTREDVVVPRSDVTA